MRKSGPVVYSMLATVMLASGAALGKLPPPTAEEQAAAAAKKGQEKVQLEKEKAQLERVQNRIAARYGKGGGAGHAGQIRDQHMPKTASELPGGVGPTPQRQQSGESHSAPAK